MPTRTKLPQWPAEWFQDLGSQILNADAHLTPENVIELILEQKDKTRVSDKDVCQEWHDHRRVWEHPDGSVRITKPNSWIESESLQVVFDSVDVIDSRFKSVRRHTTLFLPVYTHRVSGED